MVDASAFQLFLLVLAGWLDRRERDALAYLMEENRVLRRQLGGCAPQIFRAPVYPANLAATEQRPCAPVTFSRPVSRYYDRQG